MEISDVTLRQNKNHTHTFVIGEHKNKTIFQCLLIKAFSTSHTRNKYLQTIFSKHFNVHEFAQISGIGALVIARWSYSLVWMPVPFVSFISNLLLFVGGVIKMFRVLILMCIQKTKKKSKKKLKNAKCEAMHTNIKKIDQSVNSVVR